MARSDSLASIEATITLDLPAGPPIDIGTVDIPVSVKLIDGAIIPNADVAELRSAVCSSVAKVTNPAMHHRTADPLEQRVLEVALAEDPEALEAATEALRHHRTSMTRWHRESSQEALRATEVVTGPRASGKTWALAEWVRQGRRETTEGVGNDRCLVVPTVDAGRHLVDAGLLTSSEVISVRQAKTNGARKLKEYAVDESAIELAAALNQIRVPAVIAVCTA
ncbi:hypothetical protein ACX80U_12130 [Arthrobacter sp. TmT3-37]